MGTNIALILGAIGTFITGVGGIYIAHRSQKRTEKVQHSTLLLEGYDEMVQNQAREIERLSKRLEETELKLLEARKIINQQAEELTAIKIELMSIARRDEVTKEGKK